jgi:hypothetical protein
MPTSCGSTTGSTNLPPPGPATTKPQQGQPTSPRQAVTLD